MKKRVIGADQPFCPGQIITFQLKNSMFWFKIILTKMYPDQFLKHWIFTILVFKKWKIEWILLKKNWPYHLEIFLIQSIIWIVNNLFISLSWNAWLSIFLNEKCIQIFYKFSQKNFFQRDYFFYFDYFLNIIKLYFLYDKIINTNIKLIIFSIIKIRLYNYIKVIIKSVSMHF